MDGSDLIREGFICPECQEDLTSFNLLQTHFELKHNKNLLNDEKSNGAISNVIAKAKTLLTSTQNTNTDQQSTYTSTNASNLNNYGYALNNNQENGYFRSHTQEFKVLRDKTIGRYVIQTNKLLITLDKLISNESIKDENKRKAYEMAIVNWIPDNDVNLCPTCARSFNILFRKHHCRLCGAIMCNKCSQFLSIKLAKQLTDPSLFMSQFKNNEFNLKRSNSNTSINSSYTNDDGAKESCLRLCADCSRLLNKKYQSLNDKANKPIIFNYYDDFYACIKESEKLYLTFTKVADSLRIGETVHSLKNAEEMRLKLLRLYQKIDLLSNTILTYGISKQQQQQQQQQQDDINTQDSDNQISREQMKLQRNIRLFAINYLKEYSFKLSQLPTAEEYEKLKEQKRRYLVEELEREKREQQITNNKPITDTSWAPSTITSTSINVQNTNNPIEVQIGVVKKYLEAAKKEQRIEEIKILEDNLKELYLLMDSN